MLLIFEVGISNTMWFMWMFACTNNRKKLRKQTLNTLLCLCTYVYLQFTLKFDFEYWGTSKSVKSVKMSFK